MIADVDAASVITAAQSGAQYGTKLIWFLIVLAVPLFLIQEVAGRVGAVTGKGLGELIRENFTKRVAIMAAIPMAVVDMISYVVDYTGVAIGFQILGLSPRISVPVVFLCHVLLVYRRKYAQAERPLLVISILFVFAWIASAYMTARGGIQFTPFYFEASSSFLWLIAANVGAVIMPFMLFYQASATAEKRTTRLWAMRTETLVGAIASELGMIVVAVATSGLSSSLNFADPKALALALSSLAGPYAPYVFAVGLVAAAFLALVVISLGSSWAIVDTMGWRKESFLWVYVAESAPAVVIPILYPEPLSLVLDLMVIFVFVLVGPGVLMGLMSTNKRIMGEYASGSGWRAAYWLSLAVVIGFGIVAVAAAL